MRDKATIASERKLLVARLRDSPQEKDISEPINCRGYGRVRHFRISRYSDWSYDPLPNLPAAKALGRPFSDLLRAQVFQLAACNWRCWYCFVDDDHRSASPTMSNYFTADELIDMLLAEENPPDVIDLSGGQPDLVPEWVLWTIEALQRRRIQDRFFLWSDDNLSTWYLWKFLTKKQIDHMVKFRNYSRVGCFKGYDENSFSFNTLAHPKLFNRQFEVFGRLFHEGFDMYAYVTFTAMPHEGLSEKVGCFVDRLQSIHKNLPLRTVPLKIELFTPTQKRIKPFHKKALDFQFKVHSAWIKEMNERYSEAELRMPICNVSMGP